MFQIVKIIKTGRMRWAEHVARMGIECIKTLVGKRYVKRSIVRNRHGWERHIIMKLHRNSI
jgi:hypothetical protein